MKAGFSIKLMLYIAPNCPRRIVQRRIVRAELSCAELSGNRTTGVNPGEFGGRDPQILSRGSRGVVGGREILLYLMMMGSMFESGDF